MNLKRKIFALAVFAGFAFAAQAQEKASPAMTAEGSVGDAKITVNYSSPAVKGRMIWGDLVPLGQVWRAGANEATTITTTKDILVEGQKLPAGTYSFFIIPGEYESTFIFNRQAMGCFRLRFFPRSVESESCLSAIFLSSGAFEIRSSR